MISVRSNLESSEHLSLAATIQPQPILDQKSRLLYDQAPMAKPKLSDELRAAIEASEMSRYRISQETGIDQATLSRFMAGKGGLGLDGIDQIARLLGLTLATAYTSKGAAPAARSSTKSKEK